MNMTTVFLQEAGFQSRRTAVRIVLALAVLLAMTSLLLGKAEVHGQSEHIDRLLALDAQERNTAWRSHTDLGDIAYYGFHYTYDRPEPLAFAVLGQRDVLPWQHRVRMLALEGQIYERDVTNPELAQLGQFDFSLVVSVLAPLLAIVLMHDAKAGERSAGRDVLLEALAGNRVLWRRRVMVLTLLLALALLLPFTIVAALQGVPWLMTAAVSVATLLHLAFWAALAGFAQQSESSAELNACRLTAVWFVLTLALPLLGRLAIVAALPVPEPGEILLQQREVVNAAWDKPKQDTMTPFVASHPAWREQAEVMLPFEWKWYYAFQQVGDETVAPLVQRYRHGLQARERAAWWLSLLSPPLLLQKSLACLARTDLSASLIYEDAVRTFHAAMREFYYPLLFDTASFSPESLAQHPRYVEPASTCVL